MVFSDNICANLGDKLSKIFPTSKTTTYAKHTTPYNLVRGKCFFWNSTQYFYVLIKSIHLIEEG